MPANEPEILFQGLAGGALATALLRALVVSPLGRAQAEAVLPAIQALGPADIIEAVDVLVAEAIEGRDLEALKPGVTRLLHLCRQPLESGPPAAASPFFDLLARENLRALAAVDALKPAIAVLTAPASAAAGAAGLDEARRSALEDPSLREAGLGRARDELSRGLSALAPFEEHYTRLENVLFPWFEARWPRPRCLSLMWSIHDDVRRSLKELRALALAPKLDPQDAARLAGRLFFDLRALVFREERILYPVAAPLLGPGELGRLYGEARAFGPGLLSKEDLDQLDAAASGWNAALAATAAATAAMAATAAVATAPAAAPLAASAAAQPASAPPGLIALDAGSLSPQTLDLILKRLHLDMTFIDPDNRVAWFSNGPHRVFPRSPSVIGRDVRNCHPHESLGRVLGLIEDFRAGRRDSEAFWIRMKGRLIHIEYFAIRGGDGAYLGVLEASEDLTDKLALQGEKRLVSS